MFSIFGGDRPVSLISTDDVKSVRDALRSLPPNYMKSSQNTGKSVQDAIAENISGVSLAIKTQDKYFTLFRQLLIFARDEEYIEKLPGQGVKVAGVGKLKPGDHRDPYSMDQLKAIFNSPLYTGHQTSQARHKPGKIVERDGKFWVPLIALHSGMRMGEIVQLLRSDIKIEQGFWFFDISKGEEKSLKTTSSKRRVPIHRRLIEIGLLHHVEDFAGSARIFPDIEKGKDGYASHNFSKWWGRYMRHIKASSEKTAFHSFRHNFASALLSAELPEYVNKALLGHAEKSVHGNYGEALKLSQLKEAVDQVSFELNFSHLI